MRDLAKLLIYSTFVFYSFSAIGQKKNITIYDNHGKITIDEIEYNGKYKDAILDVSKYIDTLKRIWITAGSVHDGTTTLSQLESGKDINPFGGGTAPSGIIIRGGEKILTLKLKNGRLLLNSDIQGIDGK